ncbi:MAG: hypothetical protein JHD16_06550 [Solirubrobacteraceae bacterium]|nr:hypothetical protein [Solirubrobacteraceae bacterium]
MTQGSITPTPLETDALEDAILAHAPLLALHPQEPHWPTDPHAFLSVRDAFHIDRRGKRRLGVGPKGKRMIPLGSAQALMNGAVSAGAVEGRLVLIGPPIPDSFARGKRPRPPLLAEVTQLPDGSTAVTYWFFFADNHAVSWLFRNFLMSHEGDWERIVVRLDDRGQPAHVAYHAHGGYRTLQWDDVPRVDDHPTRPVVFSARGSHASYPTGGWQKQRPFDVCAKSLRHAETVPLWNVDAVTRVEAQPWYRLGVRWGDGPRSRGRSGASPFGPGNRTGCPASWFLGEWH